MTWIRAFIASCGTFIKAYCWAFAGVCSVDASLKSDELILASHQKFLEGKYRETLARIEKAMEEKTDEQFEIRCQD